MTTEAGTIETTIETRNSGRNAPAALRSLIMLGFNLEARLMSWMETYHSHMARVAMVVVYLWFGVLKLIGLSAANPMVRGLQAKTLPFLSYDQFIVLFALFEMLIGVLFLIPKATRVALVLFALHMVTTTMPLFLLPGMTWQTAFVPTMEGQYIIKNIVLIALAINLAVSFRRRLMKRVPAVVLLAVMLLGGLAVTAPKAHAEETIGGHIGFVLPLVTRAGGQTSNLADHFSIGFPVGITVKGSGRTAFDLELVPAINTARPRETTLTVHPGVVWNVGHGFGAGVRAAFDVNSASYGFTPLVNHSWPIRSGEDFFKAYFIEAVLPVRFNRPVGGPATDPVTFGLHFGLAF
jgi:uncharacterized membrane protein YphA (DoxX/SURF4 family)